MKTEPNLKIFLISFCLAVVMLAGYEMFRKSQGWLPGFDDNPDLWSYWRGKIDHLDSNDVVIIGSSRSHFNFDLNKWEKMTGKKPVMLSVAGSSPYWVIDDIVNKSEFVGKIVVGVAPGLFFTTGNSEGATWIKSDFIDYFYKQTYAQDFNQWVYSFIDPHFAFLDIEISLKSTINAIPLKDREGVFHFPSFPGMVTQDRYRNVTMVPKMETDTTHQRVQKDIWDTFGYDNFNKDSIESIFAHYLPLINKYKEKGGDIAFIFSPITGPYRKYAIQNFPDSLYWDRLLIDSKSLGYHYKNYPEMVNMEPPEWSHLNNKDADRFTEIIVNELLKDNFLKQ